MKIFILLLAFSACYCAAGQRYIWPPTPAAVFKGMAASGGTIESSDIYQDLLRNHDPLLYVSPFPNFTPLNDRQIELGDGEGRGGYWLEGQMSHRFILAKGKSYSRKALQRLRATFDIGFLVRMARDKSDPLLPGNNDVGIGVDYLLSSLKNMTDMTKTKLWMKIQMHHYSNGQSGDFYLNPVLKRHRYENGNFSTNYILVQLNAARLNNKNHLLSTGLGYQHNLALCNPLEMNEELTHNYGVHRLLAAFQIQTHPIEKEAKRRKKTVTFTKYHQWAWRTELSAIVDKNLKNYAHDSKYRLGWHNYVYWMPSLDNEVGFQVHTYVGRDYLNIRFDDVIFSIQGGFIVKIGYRRYYD